ncbi:17564_t:CDS:2 [Cetraspora pellucida]|uniref:17564_t:CDS:1 n=1 Tax=Cetraspora pellucida TaxID=1433469 RepID=A0ACA9MPQ9_9GLOM|nr:17564_t:CDS:2 [Cetraspora pellucida]
MDSDISDIKEFQNNLVNSECEQKLLDTDTEQLDELFNEDDKFPEIAYIDYGKIIQKTCSVKFYKFIPKDLKACPFVALVCIKTHNHLPSPFEKILADIKANLQTLIHQAISKNNTIISRNIHSNNLIKAFFKSETLIDIHESLNSIDKLQILVAKAYKNLHSYGQKILDVFHATKNNHSELKNYI